MFEHLKLWNLLGLRRAALAMDLQVSFMAELLTHERKSFRSTLNRCSFVMSPIYFARVVRYCGLVNKNQHKVNILKRMWLVVKLYSVPCVAKKYKSVKKKEVLFHLCEKKNGTLRLHYNSGSILKTPSQGADLIWLTCLQKQTMTKRRNSEKVAYARSRLSSLPKNI